jgi:uncharacterized repeat protein (TIGR03803 family)
MSPLRYGVSLSAAAVLLAGCGGPQPPLSMSQQALMPQQSLGHQGYDVLHPFGRSTEDGTHPEADLIEVKGTLYGTTVTGGTNGGYGTVFAIAPSGQETILHSFGAGSDGANPTSRLLYVNGTLYGTTAQGGKNGGGTVFSVTLDGSEKVLHNFESNYSPPEKYGSIPEAGLTYVNGTLYGTTAAGGTNFCDEYDFCGTVFSITTRGKFKVLHSFGQGHDGDGVYPYAPLLNVGGLLYGTTSSGGEYSSGTVFSITTAGKEHTVYSFGANAGDGAEPMSGLIDVAGKLYGTTMLGGSGPGSYGNGSVFAVTPDGFETMLFSFNGSDGSEPLADLKNVKGVLYGTTTMGGIHNLGTVFRITMRGKQMVLHSFAKGSGQQPRAGLTPLGGTLYGTTFGTTASHPETYGNVFSLTP